MDKTNPDTCHCPAYPVAHHAGWCEHSRAVDLELDLFRLELGLVK